MARWRCRVHKSADLPDVAPELAAVADPEYSSRIEAQRVTLQFGARGKRLDRGRVPITESPLFGGPAQSSLFEGESS